MNDREPHVGLGGDLHGYLALPQSAAPHRAVLLFMEAFGLNDYIRSECDRLGRLGYAALAPDFYRGDVFDYANFDPVARKIAAIGDDGFMADVRAAAAYLDDNAAIRHDGYGIVGFCMGGRLALLTAAELGERIAGFASFYGGGIAPSEPRLGRAVLVPRVPEISARALMLYGADDATIAPDEIGRVSEAFAAAKKDATVRVLPGAGHGFASVDRPSYVPAVAEAAWTETASFLAAAFATPA